MDAQTDLDRLQREAVDWVVRLTSGEATQDDAERLTAWRTRSPAHEEAFRLASLTWRDAGGTWPARRSAPMSRRLFLAGAGAGAAMAAGWAGVSLGVFPSPTQLLSDHATTVGQQAHIDLPDGSTVELDGASALDASITADARTARLVTGAAAFDVKQNPHLFEISAGPCTVTTRDAAFAVTTGSGPTRIECTRGTLAIAGHDVSLTAGERLTFEPGHALIPEPVDPAKVAPWRRGLLIFENRPFAEVVADINRHRRGRVVLARPGLGERRIDGVFHLDRPDEIVSNLAALLRLRDTWLPGGIVILT